MTQNAGPLSRWKSLAKVRFQVRVEDFRSETPPESEVVISPGSESFGLGQEHQSGREFKSIGYDIVPSSINLELNSYRDADQVRITIAAKQMPFDPRVLRAMTVQVFMGTIDPITYAEAMDGPDAPGLLLPDHRHDGVSNEVFRGFVDDYDEDLNESDSIEITARDLTQPFIDAELPENALRGIPAATRLDDVIRLMIFGDGLPASASKRPGLPGVKGVQIVNDVGALPRLDQIKPPNWFDSKKMVKKGRRRSKKNAKKIKYWDMMTDLCVAAGFIIYVRPGKKPVVGPSGRSYIPPAEVVISNPRTHYGESASDGEDVVSESEVRQFVVGLNVDRARIRRNFGGTSVPTAIEVRTFDTSLGERFSARFPPQKKVNRASTSGKGDREEVAVFIVRSQGGDGLQARLDAMAESIYEQISRGELKLRIETKALAFLPSNMNPKVARDSRGVGVPSIDHDPDIFRLKAGDPISLSIDKGDYESERVKESIILSAQTVDGAKDRMVKSGVRPDVARAIAEAARSQNLQTEFRTGKLTVNYSQGQGFAFEIEAMAYIDVRNSLRNVS